MDNNTTPDNAAAMRKVPFMIYGNPLSNAGYNPIFYFNKPTFTAPGDLSPAGMMANDYYFTVTISPAFVTVVLIQNNVRSAGASREGILKLAMAVPKGYRVAAGQTPYEVLKAMRDAFVATYMEPYRLGDTSGFRYKANMPGQEPLNAVLDRFSLEPALLPHRVMTGSSPALLKVPAAMMHDLFADLQYPEFSQFKEIVVGQQGALTPVIQVSSIPRRPNWKLLVNNMPMSWGNISNIYTDEIDIKSDKDPRYYNDAAITFTIDDARLGAVKNVTVDEVAELVKVSLHPTEKERIVPVIVEGLDRPDSQMAMSQLALFADGKRVSAAKGTVALRGKEIDAAVKAEFTGKDFEIIRQHCDADGLHILMKSLRKMKNAGKPGSLLHPEAGVTAGNVPLTVKVACSRESPEFNTLTADISVSAGELHSTLHKSAPAEVETVNGKKIYRATFALPDNFIGQARVTVYSRRAESAEKSLILNSTRNEVNFLKKDFAGKDFFSRISRKPLWITTFAVLALIIFGAIGWGAYKIFFSQEEKAVATDKNSSPWYKDELIWKSINTRLLDPALTFVEADSIDQQIQALSAIPEAKPFVEKHRGIVDMVKNYTSVINDIRAGDAMSMKENAQKINEIHRNMLKSAYMGWVDSDGPHFYQAQGIAEAMSEFTKNASSYKSFKDVDNIHLSLTGREDKNHAERKRWLEENTSDNTSNTTLNDTGNDSPQGRNQTERSQKSAASTRQKDNSNGNNQSGHVIKSDF
ncbi:MAG: hypothetical protein NC328_02065 [Muribaculum sp.]|nr:hypothetical protein [Muribaculum sp.]